MTPAARETELERTQRLLRRLLTNVGDLGECGWCHRTIYWVRHKPKQGLRGAAAPYDLDGEIHFSTCPRKGAKHG
jgi:hypothetical protein